MIRKKKGKRIITFENEICTEFDEERDVPFEVVGAGNIILSVDNNHQCGGIQGFSFGAEWGRFGYTGGVISNEEAIRLAKYILRVNNLNNLLED